MVAQFYSDWHFKELVCGHLRTAAVSQIDVMTSVQISHECFCFKFIIFLLLMTAFLVMALIRVIDFSMKLYKIMVFLISMRCSNAC